MDEIGDIPALSTGGSAPRPDWYENENRGNEFRYQKANNGEIIKRVRDFLIILRKGVLYSLSVNQGSKNDFKLSTLVNFI